MPSAWPDRTAHTILPLPLPIEVPQWASAAPRTVAVLLTGDGPPRVDNLPSSWSVVRSGPFAVLAATGRATGPAAALPEGTGWVLASTPEKPCDANAPVPRVSLTALAPSTDGNAHRVLPGDAIVLAVPVRTFPSLAERLPDAADEAFGEAVARLIAGYLRTLAGILPTVRPADIPLIVEATGALLEACLDCGPLPSRRGERDQPVGPRAKVERVIRDNLGSARLDTRRICELSGISRSVLYRLFETSGGVAAYVRALRLELVREDLADPALADLPISRLAERRGLHCTPSFNRAFRRAFGCTPGAVRGEAIARAQAPRPHEPAPCGDGTRADSADDAPVPLPAVSFRAAS